MTELKISNQDIKIQDIECTCLEMLARRSLSFKHYKLMTGLKLIATDLSYDTVLSIAREVLESLLEKLHCIVQFSNSNRILVIPPHSIESYEAPYMCLGINIDEQPLTKLSSETEELKISITVLPEDSYTPVLRINREKSLAPINVSIGTGYRAAHVFNYIASTKTTETVV
jgi:hypothetical protein